MTGRMELDALHPITAAGEAFEPDKFGILDLVAPAEALPGNDRLGPAGNMPT